DPSRSFRDVHRYIVKVSQSVDRLDVLSKPVGIVHVALARLHLSQNNAFANIPVALRTNSNDLGEFRNFLLFQRLRARRLAGGLGAVGGGRNCWRSGQGPEGGFTGRNGVATRS